MQEDGRVAAAVGQQLPHGEAHAARKAQAAQAAGQLGGGGGVGQAVVQEDVDVRQAQLREQRHNLTNAIINDARAVPS